MSVATPLSTSGRFIVDAHGKRVRLAGVNWYGASEDRGFRSGWITPTAIRWLSSSPRGGTLPSF